jgi:hypothetical protein
MSRKPEDLAARPGERDEAAAEIVRRWAREMHERRNAPTPRRTRSRPSFRADVRLFRVAVRVSAASARTGTPVPRHCPPCTTRATTRSGKTG